MQINICLYDTVNTVNKRQLMCCRIFHYSVNMKAASLRFFTICVVFAVANTNADTIVRPKNRGMFQPRIVGGADANDGQFPYQISLRFKIADMNFCGGSIISDRFLLTAAHCMEDIETRPRFIFAVIGSIYTYGGIKVNIDKITSHEGWSRKAHINDISLLRTATKMIFSDTVQPIALPTHDMHEEGNRRVVLSGWGKNSVIVRQTKTTIYRQVWMKSSSVHQNSYISTVSVYRIQHKNRLSYNSLNPAQ